MQQSYESVTQFVGENISKEVVIENRTHRRGEVGIVGEAPDPIGVLLAAQKVPNRRLPSPLGSVRTPKPRSMTSTGPPWSRSHLCRAAAGRHICPEDETAYS